MDVIWPTFQYTYIYTYRCMCVYLCVFVHVHVCVCLCVRASVFIPNGVILRYNVFTKTEGRELPRDEWL